MESSNLTKNKNKQIDENDWQMDAPPPSPKQDDDSHMDAPPSPPKQDDDLQIDDPPSPPGSVRSSPLNSKPSSPLKKPKIVVAFDFDNTLTAFHYFGTYAWGHHIGAINDDAITAKNAEKIKKMCNDAGVDDLHELLILGSMGQKAEFVAMLFGGEDQFKTIVLKLREIKQNYKFIDVDLYISTMGRIETFNVLFTIMRHMKGVWAEFLSLFSGIHMANLPMSWYQYEIGPLFADINLNVHGQYPHSINSKLEFLESLPKTAPTQQISYDYTIMVDDSELQGFAPGEAKIVYIQVRDYSTAGKSVDFYNYNTFDGSCKDIGNRALIDTVDTKVSHLLTLLDKLSESKKKLPEGGQITTYKPLQLDTVVSATPVSSSPAHISLSVPFTRQNTEITEMTPPGSPEKNLERQESVINLPSPPGSPQMGGYERNRQRNNLNKIQNLYMRAKCDYEKLSKRSR